MLRTIFVSSTFADLQTHRKAVWDALASFDVTVRGMEQFGARTGTPLETCLLEVDQSDIYLGIIGFRLGSIEASSGKSYTQLEYERALALSKEILVYLVDEENARVPIKYVDRGEARDKLESFKSILRERHTIDTYVDESDLAGKLKRDLKRLLSPKQDISTEPDEFVEAQARLSIFGLMPKAVAGSEIRLKVRLTGPPYPAARAICQAFNFEFGATIGVPIEVVLPADVKQALVPDVYVSAKHGTEVLSLKRGDVFDAYVRLHFADARVERVRARFKTEFEYDNLSRMAADALGKVTRHEPDTYLALEVSKLLTITRGERAV